MSAVLTAAMVLSVAGCSSQPAQSPSAETTTTAAETTAAETTEAETTAAETEAEKTGAVQADIVVIGGGGAGMTAAIQAVQDGATDVVVLEKMPVTGGNTTRSTGGLNAAGTKYQEADGIEDSVELFVEDTMKGGKDLNDKELVTVMAENSSDAVDWVNDIGGDLSVVGMFGGASVKRIHRPSDTSAVGPMLMKALNAKAEELGIPVLLETKAEKILLDDKGAVCGVQATDKDGNEMNIDCTAVILATGGFGANSDMVVEYKADLAGFCTTNHPGATGDGIAMAKEVGAAFVDMEQIQTHPTVNPDTTTMYTEGHHLQLAAQVAVRKHHAFGRRGGTRSVNDRREIIPVRYGYGAKRIGSLVDHPEVHAAHHEVQPGDDLLRDLREQFIGNDERFGLGMQDDLVEFGARKIRQDGYDHHARHGRGKISDAPVRHVVAQ